MAYLEQDTNHRCQDGAAKIQIIEGLLWQLKHKQQLQKPNQDPAAQVPLHQMAAAPQPQTGQQSPSNFYQAAQDPLHQMAAAPQTGQQSPSNLSNLDKLIKSFITFSKGEKVFYKENNGLLIPAQITKVDITNANGIPQGNYTVKFADGKEKDTLPEYLQPRNQ